LRHSLCHLRISQQRTQIRYGNFQVGWYNFLFVLEMKFFFPPGSHSKFNSCWRCGHWNGGRHDDQSIRSHDRRKYCRNRVRSRLSIPNSMI
jgi:hypothetical protein